MWSLALARPLCFADLYPLAVKKLRWERIKLSLIHEAKKRLRQDNPLGNWDLALGQMELDLDKVGR